MKYSFAVLALLGLVNADDAPKPSPDNSRSVFETHRNTASNVVSTQQAFEAKKTADVAARNAANTKETWDQKAHVRTARVDQTWGGYPHRQWVTRAQISTPDDSRAAFDAGVTAAHNTVTKQYATNDAWDIEVKNTQDKIAAETAAKKRGVRDSRVNMTRGNVPPARDSKGWSLKMQTSTPDDSRAAFDAGVAAAHNTVTKQYATNDAWDIEVKNTQDKIAADTAAKKRGVRDSRINQTRGEVPAARDSRGWSLKMQTSTPDDSRSAFDAGVKAAHNTVTDQYATNDAWDIEVKNTQDRIAAETAAKKRGVRDSRINQTRGEVPAARDSRGWSLKMQTSTPDASRKAWENQRMESQNIVKQQYADNDQWDIDVQSAQDKYEAQTDEKKNSVRSARDNQIKNDVPAARDSRGWYAQIDTPEDSYKAKADSLKEVLATTKAQRAFEAKSNADVETAQDKYAAETKANRDRVVAARDHQTRGDVRQARDSKGWRLMAQQEKKDTINADGYDFSVASFVEPNIVYANAQVGNSDTINPSGYNSKVAAFTAPNIIYKEDKDHEQFAQQLSQDTINAAGYDKNVAEFTAPNIVYREDRGHDDQSDQFAQINDEDIINPAGYDSRVAQFVQDNVIYGHQEPVQVQVKQQRPVPVKKQAVAQVSTQEKMRDSINPAGYDERVSAFVGPNIVYTHFDDPSHVQVEEEFLGNPERVTVLDPIAYQTRANSNTIYGVNVKRTTFYDKQNKLWRGNFDMI